MAPAAFRGEDLHDLDAPCDERIADQRAVASPWDGLGAHDGRGLFRCERDEQLERRVEFGCLHVVRETAEGGVAPAGIGRIDAGVTQPAQSFHMPVTDPAVTEEASEIIAVELGIVPGTGYGPNIHQPCDSVCPQQVDKFVEAAVQEMNTQVGKIDWSLIAADIQTDGGALTGNGAPYRSDN